MAPHLAARSRYDKGGAGAQGEAGMIIVHHLENSRSQRVLWLLEELGLDFEIRRYARNPRTMLAPPELARVHPLGKSPVIEESGRVVAETGAIVEYLLDKADGRLGPPSNRDAVLRLFDARLAGHPSVEPLGTT